MEIIMKKWTLYITLLFLWNNPSSSMDRAMPSELTTRVRIQDNFLLLQSAIARAYDDQDGYKNIETLLQAGCNPNAVGRSSLGQYQDVSPLFLLLANQKAHSYGPELPIPDLLHLLLKYHADPNLGDRIKNQFPIGILYDLETKTSAQVGMLYDPETKTSAQARAYSPEQSKRNESRYFTLAKGLIDHGATPSSCVRNGVPLLQQAALEKQDKWIQFFHEQKLIDDSMQFLILHELIKANNYDGIEKWLKAGFNPDGYGKAPVFSPGHDYDMSYLGISILSIFKHEGYCRLLYKESIKIIKLFLEYGANPNSKNSFGRTLPLKLVYLLGREAGAPTAELKNYLFHVAKILIGYGVNPAQCVQNGIPLFHQAIADEREDWVKFLCESGIDINAHDANGQSALKQAIGLKNYPMIRLLLSLGANIEELKKAVEIAEFQRDPILNDILTSASDPQNGCPFWFTALHGNLSTLSPEDQMILTTCKSNQHDPQNQKTLLHYAAMGGNASNIEYLINECGSYVNTRDIGGNTPLHLAAMRGHTKVAEKLIEHKAFRNARNDLTETPFMIAIANGHTNLATMLLVDQEANPNVWAFSDSVEGGISQPPRNTWPFSDSSEIGVVSPLDIAMARKDQDMIQLLLLCGARPYERKGGTVRCLLPPQMISNIYGKCTQDRRTMHLAARGMGTYVPNVFRNIASFLYGDTMAKIIVGHNFSSLLPKKIEALPAPQAIGSEEERDMVHSDCATVGSDDILKGEKSIE
jgi:ankyrin repeat protein